MAEQNIKSQNNYSQKKYSLIFKFAMIFLIFTIVTLVLVGFTTYFFQNKLYKQYVEDQAKQVADYLNDLLSDETLDFEKHQQFIIDHHDDVLIPYDYDYNYEPAKQKFEEMFGKEYPGKVYKKDVAFEDMSYELQVAHAVYVQEYCLNVFEQAQKRFNVAYTYYMVPDEENHYCYFVIDALREEKEINGKRYIELALYIDENLEKAPVLWKVWNSKIDVHEFEIYDNEFGYTYGYYKPLTIKGHRLGLIAIDLEIMKVNKEILNRTIKQILGIALILVICVIFLLIFINKKYIHKIDNLANNVKQYTVSKDPEIAGFIEYDVNTSDEISSLASQTAFMILELDKYMKNLVSTTRELSETKQEAKNLQALANKDSLTGIRNKTAYDNEINKLREEIKDGLDKYGIGMIDLNFLKKTNDEYGHDKGNVAIKNLCKLVCNVFKHSPVFRIGGDEFAIILKNNDYEIVDQLVVEFKGELERLGKDKNLKPWERISAAIGYALYDPNIDSSIEDVFERADAEMYKCKVDMKATRE
ncbi:MAG: GGDEF domain-containing protein [Lachnospiraceae bacterium]|nr:GGDEF domain-containing protein [Lachnospiraceae bacterium]